ncbi:hypothetical protein BMS3Bbin15_01951 [archaeon BMS3Bbin15]|nr:hypothetical protein BMS3Bbin15_01951 [archaeon BMS3Bbin15]
MTSKFTMNNFLILKNKCLQCGKDILKSRDFCSKDCEKAFFKENV